jgi:uroporphyrinogen decarboxylase
MRQAGRYLPEYRATRAEAGSFMDLCRNAELASEVAMQPLRRYELDASILFSDILTIPDALGLGLDFVAGEGPVFERPIRQDSDIEALPGIDVHEELGYVFDVVRAMREKIGQRLPIIGFSGSPWTLACYMLEGRGTRDFATARRWLWQRPDAVHALLDRLADVVIDYLAAQAEAGVDVLMLFDTWGGLLDEINYRDFSLRPMSAIVAGLRQRHGLDLPVILFSKGCHSQVEDMLGSGCQGIGLDWRADLDAVLDQVDGRVAVQGNLDPTSLLAAPDRIPPVIRARYADAVRRPGYIFNLGHGLLPQTDPDSVALAIDTVHALAAD